MKTIQTILLILLVGNLSWNCKSNKDSSKIEAKIDRVMGIHDEVMPKMDALHDYAKKLEKFKPTITENVELGHLERQIGQLDDAGEMMMDWMRKYENPGEDDPRSTEEIMAYLNDQEKKIVKVRNAMIASLEEAIEAYNNHQENK